GSQELATLHFDRGRIVSARCGLRRGEAAVYRALRLQEGRFTVRRAKAVRARLSLPITAAILEGVRRHDECERLRATLPGEDVILSWLGGRIPVDLRGGASDAAELFVIPRTIDEGVRASSEDELALLEELVAFVPRLSSRELPPHLTPAPTPPAGRALPIPSSPPSRRPPPPPSPTRAPHGPPGAPPRRDDYELVPVSERDVGDALADQSTLEPFVFDPASVGSSTPPALTPRQRVSSLTAMPPRVLAGLAGVATLMTFFATFAILPARSSALTSIAPHVARWMHDAWCTTDAPPPAVAKSVCRLR
ncbi:MAG: DUF4388 domain-containing protein, partial [Polyangiaceae bacterium]